MLEEWLTLTEQDVSRKGNKISTAILKIMVKTLNGKAIFNEDGTVVAIAVLSVTRKEKVKKWCK